MGSIAISLVDSGFASRSILSLTRNASELIYDESSYWPTYDVSRRIIRIKSHVILVALTFKSIKFPTLSNEWLYATTWLNPT
jgi:hypothetical protein